jgi:hypothetical protein
MKRTMLAVVVGLVAASPAQAQIVFGPGYGAGHGRGLGFSYQKHNLQVYGFAGGYSARSAFVVPVVPVAPFGSGFGYGPGFGYGFGGPGWGVYAPQPQVIVVPPPIILAGNWGDGNANPNPNGNANPLAGGGGMFPQPDEPRPLPARPADFLVIVPKKPDFPPPGKLVPEVERVAPGGRPPLLPPPKFDPFAMPPVMKIDRPDPDPVKEAARLVKLGRESFAVGEYGKASELFDRAAATNPKFAEPQFLKAQAAFAAGSYADAVAAIRAGLSLDPAWPASTFDPKEPYGANPATFAAHLAELRKVTAANPGESTLEFLLGYQLWFVGEKVEARKWFAAAEKRLPGTVALFK